MPLSNEIKVLAAFQLLLLILLLGLFSTIALLSYKVELLSDNIDLLSKNMNICNNMTFSIALACITIIIINLRK